MSRNRILIFTTALLLSCFSAMAFELPKGILKSYLKPWCELKKTTIKNLKVKFSDKELGAFNFSLECTRAIDASFDKKNSDNSCLIGSKVIFAVIYVGYSIYEKQDGDQKNIALLYRIKDGIKMLNNRSVIKNKLKEEERQYLNDIYKEEIPVQKSSSESEDEEENESIDDDEDSEMKEKKK